jgi:hypothetical protein
MNVIHLPHPLKYLSTNNIKVLQVNRGPNKYQGPRSPQDVSKLQIKQIYMKLQHPSEVLEVLHLLQVLKYL